MAGGVMTSMSTCFGTLTAVSTLTLLAIRRRSASSRLVAPQAGIVDVLRRHRRHRELVDEVSVDLHHCAVVVCRSRLGCLTLDGPLQPVDGVGRELVEWLRDDGIKGAPADGRETAGRPVDGDVDDVAGVSGRRGPAKLLQDVVDRIGADDRGRGVDPVNL